MGGNAPAIECAQNALKVLTMLKRTDIPLIVGTERTIDGKQRKFSTEFHGDGGLHGRNFLKEKEI